MKHKPKSDSSATHADRAAEETREAAHYIISLNISGMAKDEKCADKLM